MIVHWPHVGKCDYYEMISKHASGYYSRSENKAATSPGADQAKIVTAPQGWGRKKAWSKKAEKRRR